MEPGFVQPCSAEPLQQIHSSSLNDLHCRSSLPQADVTTDADKEWQRRKKWFDQKWRELDTKTELRIDYEGPRESSKHRALCPEHHSLPSTPLLGRKNDRSRCCPVEEQSCPNTEREQYRVLLQLVTAKLNRKTGELPLAPMSNGKLHMTNQPGVRSKMHQKVMEKLSEGIKRQTVEQQPACKLSEEVSSRLCLDKGHSAAAFPVPASHHSQEMVHSPGKSTHLSLFTEAMAAEVKQVLGRGDPDQLLASGFKLKITRKDICTLCNNCWLNDEVINFYMCLIVERGRGPGQLRAHAFSTFFYLKLQSGGHHAVRQWTKATNLFHQHLILMPVHLGMHWCLAVADLRERAILYLDSLGQSNDAVCRELLQYLDEESQRKRGQTLNSAQWILRSLTANEIPQQRNSSDCGVFVCKYAEYMTRDQPITFTQGDVLHFRRRMVWEILHQTLL
eukprot:gi/632987136/ref/XP_007910625.1/ PREDICTED: sentrin-specific protease 2-like [Callorhinchus milii]